MSEGKKQPAFLGVILALSRLSSPAEVAREKMAGSESLRVYRAQL